MVLILLTTPTVSFLGTSFIQDLNTRMHINDSYLGVYYFCWTNLSYLPIFFLLLALSILLETSALLTELLWLGILIVFSVYCTEFWNNLTSNVHLTISCYVDNDHNKLLTNTLNRYHPFVFYISVSGFFQIWVMHYCLTNNLKAFQHTYWLFKTTTTGWGVVVLNLTALWMGSWWALQEGTWGGWWNWDSSEVFGALVTFVLLTKLHSSLNIITGNYRNLKFTVLGYWFILGYLFVQLNFDLVTHNFGTKFFFFFNNNFFFFELIIFLIIVLTTILLKHKNLSVYLRIGTFTSKIHKNTLYALRLIPMLLILYSIFGGYKSLVSYFFWNFIYVSTLNVEIFWQPLSIVSFIFVWFWLSHKITTTHCVLVTLSLFLINLNSFSLLFVNLTSLINIIHASLALFCGLNILSFDTSVNQLLLNSSYNYILTKNLIFLTPVASFTLDSNSIEIVNTTYTYDQHPSLIWSISNVANASILDCFQLISTHDTLSNLFRIGLSYSHIYMSLELPHIFSLNTLISIIIVSTPYLTRLKFRHWA